MNNNRTLWIIVTVVTAVFCCCAAIFSGVFGGLIASGTPFDVTDTSGITSKQTFPAPIGYVLLCLTVLFILVPIAVGFFTLRKKPETAAPSSNEPLPPTS